MSELRDSIKRQVQDWASKKLGSGFKFRERQFEQIVGIVSNIVEGTEDTQIVEAPTGSGKSIIILVSAGVLADYYNLESYVLCSDLFLFSQYEDFINKHNLDMGCLKGITGNYICKNHKCFLADAPCKLSKSSYRKLKIFGGSKFDCSMDCQYMKARKKLVSTKVGVMTYSLFMFQMNICADDSIDQVFGNMPGAIKKRDVIFCDEAHKIPSITQAFVSPFLSPENDFPIYKAIIEKVFKSGKFDFDDYFGKLKGYYENMRNTENVYEIWHNYMCYHGLLKTVKTCSDIISKIYSKVDYDSLKPHEKFVLGECNHFSNLMCYLNDFIEAIDFTHPKYLVKKNQKNGINLNCILESSLICKYLLYHSRFVVLTSATIGNVENFTENCGIEDFEFAKIPSNFEFNNSPILYISGLKMSQNHLNNSFDEQLSRLMRILDSHKNERGIIHTASYKLANRVYESLPEEYKERIILYKDSKAKNASVEKLKKSSNAILMGPSIIEGLDLPDDLCRFNIIFKIQFPSMGDKYVARKMRIYKKWYNSHTATNVIQALGRGIRHKTDECKCYILDGCFGRLKKLTKGQWPNEFTNRLIEIDSEGFNKMFGKGAQLSSEVA